MVTRIFARDNLTEHGELGEKSQNCQKMACSPGSVKIGQRSLHWVMRVTFLG